MKIVIRTDASLQIGTGHVMRCLTLAKALKAQGANVSFICREHIGHLINSIQQQGFEVFVLPRLPTLTMTRPGQFETEPKLFHADWLGVSQQEDAAACQNVLKNELVDWLIIDHYAIDERWQLRLKKAYKKLMVIDDLGDRRHRCDLLLDQNYGSMADKYRDLVPSHCTVLTGANYALLRPEFAHWRAVSLKRRQNSGLNTLLITLGGVDQDNVTEQILQTLKNTNLSPSLTITVIMGSKAPYLQQITALASTLQVPTEVRVNVNNMAEVMANADLAIGAAGATTWERCCLGLPTIQMVIAENQKASAQALAKDQVIKLLDSVADLPGLVASASDWMQGVSHKASLVCDGLGVDRVLNQLGLVKK